MGSDPCCEFLAGSNDQTPEICQKLAEGLPNVRVLAEPKSGGLGWDMRRGLDALPRQIHRRDRRRRAVSSRGDIFLLRQDKERRFRLCKNAPRPAPRRPLSDSDFSRLQLAFSYPLPRLGQISGRELETEDYDTRGLSENGIVV